MGKTLPNDCFSFNQIVFYYFSSQYIFLYDVSSSKQIGSLKLMFNRWIMRNFLFFSHTEMINQVNRSKWKQSRLWMESEIMMWNFLVNRINFFLSSFFLSCMFIVNSAVQMPQSGQLTLDLPYVIIGLGSTPNFVEKITVGIPPNRESVCWMTQFSRCSQQAEFDHGVEISFFSIDYRQMFRMTDDWIESQLIFFIRKLEKKFCVSIVNEFETKIRLSLEKWSNPFRFSIQNLNSHSLIVISDSISLAVIPV